LNKTLSGKPGAVHTDLRHHTWGLAIDTRGQRLLLFSLVHVGISGSIDHRDRPDRTDRRTTGRRVAQIRLGARQTPHTRQLRQRVPHLPGPAKY